MKAISRDKLIKAYDDAFEIIDAYLNAGSKDARKAISDRAKEWYRDYTGKEYKNRNERS